ncbi:hypothetical protein SAMN05444161_5857 [Rhizobiales bacterium GAS191]|nr:hypothetical protein SAMN05444161_5857 [Rhizobiales bacterium GAS191]
MKSRIAGILCTAILSGFVMWSLPAGAQQKTTTACRDEWRANKATMQANKITQKAYVAQCTSGVAASQPPVAPPASAAPAIVPTSPGRKTATACRDEWRADKATMQANKITEKAYVAQCTSGVAAAQPPAAPPTPAPVAATPQPPPVVAPRPAPVAPVAVPARTPAAGTPAGLGEYATEAEAKSHCPGDTVVWANLHSKIYHFNTSRNYGSTKAGAYMCERDTAAAGVRAPKNEAHP